MDIRLTLEQKGKSAPLTFSYTRMINAGYVGRDQEEVRRHIDELAKKGIPGPKTTPTAYPVICRMMVTDPEIEVYGDETCGEAEYVLFVENDGTIYVAANGNDVFAFKPDGTLKWTRDLGSDIGGAPAVGSDGTIFIGNDGDKMFALRPSDGLNAHTPFQASGHIRSRPAIDSADNVYFGTTNGYFYKLDSNLIKKWKFTVDDILGGSSPAPIRTSPRPRAPGQSA